MNRRDFFQSSLLSTAGLLALPGQLAAEQPAMSANNGITDTYVNLFDWPFRPLKYSSTRKLAQKLAKHNVKHAWAGSFQALLYKNIDKANAALAEECSKKNPVSLLPIGSVNTTWPDWEEDLRRCATQYSMKGIRIFPNYQMIRLDSPQFLQLAEMATKMNMFIQIVGDIEDPRHHHPLIVLKDISYEPLLELPKKVPGVRIQLLHWNRKVPNPLLQKIIANTSFKLDISRIEGAGELGRLIQGNGWYGPKEFPIPTDRFLFGSHAPYFPIESALFKLFEAPLEQNQIQAITSTNAQSFLKA